MSARSPCGPGSPSARRRRSRRSAPAVGPRRRPLRQQAPRHPVARPSCSPRAPMAFVTAPWQLVALRALLGVFAGYGALTMSMAAESVPREEMPRAIGVVQMGSGWARDRAHRRRHPRAGRRLAPVVPDHRGVLSRGDGPGRGGIASRGRAWRARPGPRRGGCASCVRRRGFCCPRSSSVPADRRSQLQPDPAALRRAARPADGQVPFVSGVLFSVAAVSAADRASCRGRLVLMRAGRHRG
jgi:hypothetical protein